MNLKIKDNGTESIESKIENTDDIIKDHENEHDNEEYIANFKFDINLDPNYTAQGQVINAYTFYRKYNLA